MVLQGKDVQHYFTSGERGIYEHSQLHGLLRTDDCGDPRSFSSDWNNNCSTWKGTVYSTATSSLPRQPSGSWSVHGIGCGLHSRHICCACSGGSRTSQAPTVPMQSVHMDDQCGSSGKAVELGSIRPFHTGNCAIWKEVNQLVPCCSHPHHPLDCSQCHMPLCVDTSCV